MAQKTILITAGPTREAIDPVRYLSNRSSGKMGYALASEAKRMGFKVVLISGPTHLAKPGGVRFISVISAREMYQAVMKEFRQADIIIKVAAVADYRPKKILRHKLKKTSAILNLALVRNPDILAALGKKKLKKQLLVGFAAETQNIFKQAREKLTRKNCDWIAVNHVDKANQGFESDNNELTLLAHGNQQFYLGYASKRILARRLLRTLLAVAV